MAGIASYQLQIMLLFHVQVQQQEDEKEQAASTASRTSTSGTSPLQRSTHLGYLLYTFFELFGVSFEYQRHGLRILNPSDPQSHLSCYSKKLSGKLKTDETVAAEYRRLHRDPVRQWRKHSRHTKNPTSVCIGEGVPID